MYESAVWLSERKPEYQRVVRTAERRARKLFGERWISEIGRAKESHELDMRRRAWGIRIQVEEDQFARFIKSEREFCEEERERVMAEFNSKQVPDPLRELVPLAQQFGVGDDPCRAYFVNKTSKQNRKRILQEVEPYLDAIEHWVKTFDAGSLPPEAAAFLPAAGGHRRDARGIGNGNP